MTGLFVKLHWPAVFLLAVAASVVVVQAGSREKAVTGVEKGLASRAEFEPEWFLVRLYEPLEHVSADRPFDLHTGLPRLDAAIRESGVYRIDLALAVSARKPADPEAFRRWGFDRTYRFHVPAGSDVPVLVGRFASLAEVDYAEPDFVVAPAAVTPNDPRYSEQWALPQVAAPDAWDITTGGDVVIATIDSGAMSSHEDLAGKIVAGWNFETDTPDTEDNSSGHGTGVASVALANTNNGKGMAGACWGCRLMPVVAGVSSSRFADAMVWATDHGARIINMSQSLTSGSWTLLNGVGYAYDAGVVQTMSAGNNPPVDQINFPAAYVETIAVGGTDASDQWSSPMCGVPGAASHYGSELDVVAPAEDILKAATDGPDTYETACGTSYSAPLVAGLLGLMQSLNPSLGREEARHLIRSGADDAVGRPAEDTPGFDVYHGWGRVDMHRTLLGTQAESTLRVEGKAATRVYFATTNPLAGSWDFVRGDLAALSEDHLGVDLGSPTCLENDSPDPDTAGNEDVANPEPGEGFFYLARFNGPPGAGSYGGSSRNRDRLVLRPGSVADWLVESGQQGARLGGTEPAGDVNGDGYDDVIVGAARYTFTENQDGLAEVYLGSAAGLDTSPNWRATSGQWGARFGRAVASAGDVNGDGYDDVIVGAYLYDNPVYNEGAAFLYLGSPSGPSATADWSADEANQSSAYFGDIAVGAGDVDGDGYDDLLINATQYDGGETDEGRAYLYYGSRNGPRKTADWTWEPDQNEAFLFPVNAVGDVNGDGYGDFVVGLAGFDNGEIDEGRAVVFYGSSSGPGAAPDVVLEIDVPGAGFGSYADGAGDVNNDGYDDVIVGAPDYTNGETGEGAAFLYLGSSSGVQTSHAWSIEGQQSRAHLGWTVSSAGDVNNDGYGDVVVGVGPYDDLRTDEGRVQVFLGSATGLSTSPVWSVFGGQAGSQLGSWGAGTGDVNGDGYGDVTVGAYGYDNGEFDEGRVFVFHGPLGESAAVDCPE